MFELIKFTILFFLLNLFLEVYCHSIPEVHCSIDVKIEANRIEKLANQRQKGREGFCADATGIWRVKGSESLSSLRFQKLDGVLIQAVLSQLGAYNISEILQIYFAQSLKKTPFGFGILIETQAGWDLFFNKKLAIKNLDSLTFKSSREIPDYLYRTIQLKVKSLFTSRYLR